MAVGSLRKAFGIGIGLLLVASVVLQLMAVSTARSSIGSDGLSSQPDLAVPTVLSTLATFCSESAVVLVLGIVALLVIDSALLRKLEIDAFGAEGESGEPGDSDEPGASGDGQAAPAYGSDPELL
jgi:hypothetical protein